MKIKKNLFIFFILIFTTSCFNDEDTTIQWNTSVITPAEVIDYSATGTQVYNDTTKAMNLPQGNDGGSLDICSLGHGGSITFHFSKKIINGPGVDFKIFENVFQTSSTTFYTEAAYIEVSADGNNWYRWPAVTSTDSLYNELNKEFYISGFAGINPVYSNYSKLSSPKPEDSDSGGDFFDLNDLPDNDPVALAIKNNGFYYIKIIDCGEHIDDAGNQMIGGDASGFDLDAVVGINYE
jgi:hypothetical protein